MIVKDADSLQTAMCSVRGEEAMFKLLEQAVTIMRGLEGSIGFKEGRIKILTENNARQAKMLDAFV